MEENKENVVEETTQETVQTVDETKFDSAGDDSVVKIDLNNPPKKEEDAVQKQSTDEVPVRAEPETSGEVQEENKEVVEEVTGESEKSDTVQDEQPVVEEITEEKIEEQVEDLVEETKEAIAEAQETGKDLPENIQKLVEFMNDTGGSVQDYVRLNTDINKLDTSEVLDEYYKQVKSHLSAEERGFLLEETFSYDEELDDAKEIKRKKIKLKEEAAKARKYLEGQKSKYYEEIKASTTLTEDQQRAIDFYNKYNKDSKAQKAATEASTKEFQQKTKDVFNDDFKGFDFNVGEKTFRYNVKNKGEVMNAQSDLNNFINKFVGSDNKIQDAKGYHKSLYTAMNADALAQHFYEQGKADAIKDAVARGKNVNTEARQTHGETQVGGVKYKILGESANNFKLKFKK